MSLRRTFIWTCDTCDRETSKDGYKLPSLWAWYQEKNQPVKQVCPDCPIPDGVDENAQYRAPHKP